MNIENLDGVVKAGICGGDYIIPAKHFHLCPLDSLKKEKFSKNQWSLSYGGSPLKAYEATIDIFRKDSLDCDRWVLPEIITFLLEFKEKLGGDNKVYEIKRVLGL